MVSEIEIRRASVFDLEEVDPESTSYGIYRFANRLHLMTREGVIRSELLIQEGDCFDEFLLQESIRALRGLEFLNQASAEVEALPDGSRKLMIRTQDDWTLEVSLGIAVDEGFTIEGLGVVEKNFLGTGTTLGWVRREDLESLENGAVVVARKDRISRLLAKGGEKLAPHLAAVKEKAIEVIGEYDVEMFKSQLAEWEKQVPEWKEQGRDVLADNVADLEHTVDEIESALRKVSRDVEADKIRDAFDNWVEDLNRDE